MPHTIFISAGEASGDLIGARLARALRARSPGLRLEAFGGPHLAAAGARVNPALSAGSVMGWTGVLRHVVRFARLLRAMRRSWTKRPPSGVILIDYPGFNLRLARIAHDLGIPAYYFICPQVWAWGSNRLLAMRRVLRRAYPVLPFEEPLHQAFGIRSQFLGHPLLDVLPARGASAGTVLRGAGIDPRRPVAVLLPGSRPDEITRILPVMLEAAAIVERRIPAVQWVVIAAPGARPQLAALLAAGPDIETHVVEDGAYAVRRHAQFAWVASGTATLELGLLGIPQVVVYRTGWANFQIARLLVQVPYASLVNLILGRGELVELLQGAATPAALANTAGRLLSPGVAGVAKKLSAELRAHLGGPGACDRVARDLIADLRKVAA